MRYTQTQYYQSKRRGGRGVAALAAFVLMLAIGWILYAKTTHGWGSAAAQDDLVQTNTVASATEAADDAAQRKHEAAVEAATESIQRIIAASDSEFSVAIVDYYDNSTVHIGSDDAFDAASTGKLVTALDFLHGVEHGTYSLDATYGTSTGRMLLQALIVNSDEMAWETLNGVLGHANMNSYAQSIGLTAYDANTNTITADDAALLLKKLYDGSLLDATNTKLLLGFMQQANYRDYIVAAAAGNTVYHKVGWNGTSLNDVAIIENADAHFAIAIYSDSDTTLDWTTRGQALRDIATAALAAFMEPS